MRDSTRVQANLRDHTFEEQVKKYTAIWNTPRPADGLVAAVGPPVAFRGRSGRERWRRATISRRPNRSRR
jgi:hypothetical protein